MLWLNPAMAKGVLECLASRQATEIDATIEAEPGNILTLDGRKRPCQVHTSNAGHCLYTGIAPPDRARRLAETLFRPESFSGWGLRTVASSESRYNPLSYHNGSIWPHDNSLIASGLAKYGFKNLAGQILMGLLDLSSMVDLHRLPEPFCGLDRRPGEGPTLYPVIPLHARRRLGPPPRSS